MDNNKVLFHTRINLLNIGHVVKKNNRPIWNGRIGKSKKLINAENHICYSLTRTKMSNWPYKTIDFPIWCMFLFYFSDFYTKPKKKTDIPRMSYTLGDLSNLYQLPEDCLVKTGIITNDALICSHDGSRKLPSQTGEDYLDIFIFKALDYE